MKAIAVVVLLQAVYFSSAFSPGRPPSHLKTALHAKSKRKKKAKDGTITVNRVAYRNYEIIEKLEAGISLKGTEIKSIRDGQMNIRDGFCRATDNGRGCILHNVHISKHSMTGEYDQHKEKRPRQLLIHKEQARRFKQKIEAQGLYLVPLKAYFNKEDKVKIEIGLCRKKDVHDKREAIKARDAKRETSRILKNFRVSY